MRIGVAPAVSDMARILPYERQSSNRPPDTGTGCAERALIHGAPATVFQSRADVVCELTCRGFAVADAVDSGPPRALTHSRRAAFRHPSHECLAWTLREGPTLDRLKPPAGRGLNSRQRTAEAGEISVGKGREQRHQYEMRHAFD